MMKILGKNEKTVFAAYFTTMDLNERDVVVNFRFPMEFGMLRAADWAEKEMHMAGEWLAGSFDCYNMSERLRYMIPLHEGKRKVLYRTRIADAELTLGGGCFRIEMVLKRMDDFILMADSLDKAVDEMVSWMRMNAYSVRLQ